MTAVRSAALLFFLLFAVHCSEAPPSDEDTAPAVAEPVVTGTVQATDGVTLAYDAGGQGTTALVFIHCWACDRTFWRGQLDTFADDYRVVALDMGGHGDSGAERETWSTGALAGDVVAVIEALDLERVILVGHSIGGPVSLDVARRLPEWVVGIVGVDTLFDVEAPEPDPNDEKMQELIATVKADFEGELARHMPTLFPEGSDPALIDWVTSRSLAADRSAVMSLALEDDGFDKKEALAAVKVPVRCINHVPLPHETDTVTAVETNRKYADYDAVLMEGVGHYAMLERPEEFNALLRQVLEDW